MFWSWSYLMSKDPKILENENLRLKTPTVKRFNCEKTGNSHLLPCYKHVFTNINLQRFKKELY